MAEVSRLTISVNARTAGAMSALAKVNTAVSRLSRRSATVTVNANTDRARARISALGNQLSRINARRSTVTVNANTGLARARLTTLNNQVTRIGARRVSVTVNANTDRANTGLRTVGNSADRTTSSFGRMGNSSRFAAHRGMGILLTMAVATASALVPLTAATGALGGAFLAMGGAAAIGFGLFGMMIKEQISAVHNLQATHGKLTKVQKNYLKAEDQMLDAMGKFSKATRDATLAPLIPVMRGAAVAVKKLIPLFKLISAEMQTAGNAVGRWLGGWKFDRFVNVMKSRMLPIMRNLIAAGRHVLAVLGYAFRALAPMAVGLSETLRRGALQLRKWAAGGGFKRFVEYVRANMPQIKDFFGALFAAIGNVLTAMRGMAPVAFIVATSLLRIVAALPPSVIQALVYAFVALRTIMAVSAGINALYALSMRAAGVATLFTRLQVLGLTIASYAYAIAARVVAGATRVWAAATTVLNAVMRLNPIIFVITLIALLVAAIVWVATKTTWFQTAWRYTWNAVKTVFIAVWNGIKTAALVVWGVLKAGFRGMLTGIRVAWSASWGAIRTAAAAVWNGLKAAARVLWSVLTAIFRGGLIAVRAVWRAVWGAMRTVAAAIWNGLKTAARVLWNVLRTVFRGGLNVIRTVWSAVWRGIRTLALAVWNGIRAAARALWGFLRTVFRGGLNVIRSVWSSVWRGIRSLAIAVWNGIRSAARAFWNFLRTVFRAGLNLIKKIWNASWNWVKNRAKAFWDLIRAIGRHFWASMRVAFRKGLDFIKNIWNRTWNWVKNLAKRVWDWVVDKARGFGRALRSTFDRLVKGLKKIWNWIKDIFAKPVKWVINTVFNKGFVPLWNNTAAKLPGLGKMEKAKGFDEGGYTGPGAKLKPAGVVHAGEFVTRKSATQKMERKNPGVLGHINRHGSIPGYASGGRARNTNQGHTPRGYASGGGVDRKVSALAGYDHGGPVHEDDRPGGQPGVGKNEAQDAASKGVTGGGGIFGAIAGKIAGIAKSSWGWASGVLKTGTAAVFRKAWDAIVKPMFGVMSGGGLGGDKGKDNVIHSEVKVLPDRWRDQISALIEGFEESVGGGNTEEAQKFADKQVGKPYRLGSAGPGAWDCSTFMSAIARVIQGKKPGGWFTTHPFHSGGKEPIKGFKRGEKAPFEIGVTGKGIGHMGGTLNGTNYEATPPRVRKGKRARGSRNGYYNHWYGFMPSKGMKGKIPTGARRQIIEKAMKAAGVPPPNSKEDWLKGMNTLIQRESGWNASAHNKSDSNAAAGIASRGLAQVIPPTFKANVPKSLRNKSIFDPVANVAAAIRYIVRRYGGINKVQQADPSKSPKGYANGGLVRPGLAMVGERGPELLQLGSAGRIYNSSQTSSLLSNRSNGASTGVIVAEGAIQISINGNVTQDNVATITNNFESALRRALQAGTGKR